MSALLPLAKAFLHFSEALRHERDTLGAEKGPEYRAGFVVLDAMANAALMTCERLREQARIETGAGPCKCEGGDVIEKPVGVFHCVGCGLPRPGWKVG